MTPTARRAPEGMDAETDARLTGEVLRLLGPGHPNWVPPAAGVDHDVVVIGGGQCGLATAFALRWAGIGNVLVVDANPAAEIGIWRTTARMPTLRTPKDIPGPELHDPALGYRAWYCARFGADAYERMEQIPTGSWAAYLEWFRRISRVPILHETRVTRVEPSGRRLRLHFGGGRAPLVTRKLVLATGYAGTGGPFVPDLAAGIPPGLWSHSDGEIDFSRLRGKVVGVVGAASAAFDNSATALEAGAREVHLLCRSADLHRRSNGKSAGYHGVSENFHALPDVARWTAAGKFLARSTPPFLPSIARACRFEGFRIHLGAGIERAAPVDGRLRLVLPGRSLDVDYLVFATGYRVDPRAIPELAGFADRIAVWADRPGLPAIGPAASAGRYPYLGPGYEYAGTDAPADGFLRNIHALNISALVSFGRHVGDIGSLQVAVPRLVRHIGRDLFLADTDAHSSRILANEPERYGRDSYWHRVVA